MALNLFYLQVCTQASVLVDPLTETAILAVSGVYSDVRDVEGPYLNAALRRANVE